MPGLHNYIEECGNVVAGGTWDTHGHTRPTCAQKDLGDAEAAVGPWETGLRRWQISKEEHSPPPSPSRPGASHDSRQGRSEGPPPHTHTHTHTHTRDVKNTQTVKPLQAKRSTGHSAAHTHTHTHTQTVERWARTCALWWSGTAVRVWSAHNRHLHRGFALGEGTTAGGRRWLAVFRDECDAKRALANS